VDKGTIPARKDAPADQATDLESRFTALIQSPLRAGLLRFLHARPMTVNDFEAWRTKRPWA
jgi:hypothetical protein